MYDSDIDPAETVVGSHIARSPHGALCMDLAVDSSPDAAPTSAGEVCDLARTQGVRYVFAQFVDMHGKPTAKTRPGAGGAGNESTGLG